jgi:hypothetical protein
MADDIIQFQSGREAAMSGLKRDGRKHRDWLEGYDQVKLSEPCGIDGNSVNYQAH